MKNPLHVRSADIPVRSGVNNQDSRFSSNAGATSPFPIGWERAGVRAIFAITSLSTLLLTGLAHAQTKIYLPDTNGAARRPAQNLPLETPEIRTPPAPATPRINGPAIFGVRPGNPFVYHIPATGDRPMSFSVSDLPAGLKLNAQTGDISGSLPDPGKFVVTFHAKNSKGSDDKKFTIFVGETIALT